MVNFTAGALAVLLIVVFVAGAWCGMIIMCCMTLAKRNDETAEKMTKNEIQKRKGGK